MLVLLITLVCVSSANQCHEKLAESQEYPDRFTDAYSYGVTAVREKVHQLRGFQPTGSDPYNIIATLFPSRNLEISDEVRFREAFYDITIADANACIGAVWYDLQLVVSSLNRSQSKDFAFQRTNFGYLLCRRRSQTSDDVDRIFDGLTEDDVAVLYGIELGEHTLGVVVDDTESMDDEIPHVQDAVRSLVNESNGLPTHYIFSTFNDLEPYCQSEGAFPNLDIVFILDSSSSVARSYFEYIRDFVVDLIQSFDIDMNKVKVGVIRFGTYVDVNIELKKHSFEKALIEAVGSILYVGGESNTVAALETMIEMFSSNATADTTISANTVHIGVVITDGKSDQPVDEVVGRAINEGVIMYAIGVGDEVDSAEIMTLAQGNKGKMFQIPNFDNLNKTIEEVITAIFDLCSIGILKKYNASMIEELLKDVQELEEHDGGDCPERGVRGIQRALGVSSWGGHIMVVTDSPAKDVNLIPEVVGVAYEMGVSVHFFFSRIGCSNDFSRYQEIAKVTNGLVVYDASSFQILIDYLNTRSLSPFHILTVPPTHTVLPNSDSLECYVLGISLLTKDFVISVSLQHEAIPVDLEILDPETSIREQRELKLTQFFKYSAIAGEWKICSDHASNLIVRNSQRTEFDLTIRIVENNISQYLDYRHPKGIRSGHVFVISSKLDMLSLKTLSFLQIIGESGSYLGRVTVNYCESSSYFDHLEGYYTIPTEPYKFQFNGFDRREIPFVIDNDALYPPADLDIAVGVNLVAVLVPIIVVIFLCLLILVIYAIVLLCWHCTTNKKGTGVKDSSNEVYWNKANPEISFSEKEQLGIKTDWFVQHNQEFDMTDENLSAIGKERQDILFFVNQNSLQRVCERRTSLDDSQDPEQEGHYSQDFLNIMKEGKKPVKAIVTISD